MWGFWQVKVGLKTRNWEIIYPDARTERNEFLPSPFQRVSGPPTQILAPTKASSIYPCRMTEKMCC